MIATRDATSETMLRALSHSLGALDAAIELDVDRTAEDRAFLSAEKGTLQPFFDEVSSADQALTRHLLLRTEALQARVELGDVVLDRLEKRLLERFPREKVYVRSFFLDVAASRKKKTSSEPSR